MVSSVVARSLHIGSVARRPPLRARGYRPRRRVHAFEMGSDEEDYGWFDAYDEPDVIANHEPPRGCAGTGLQVAGGTASGSHDAARSDLLQGSPLDARDALGPGCTTQPDLVTRAFLLERTTPVWAWGVGGLRIVRDWPGVVHAEFQIVAWLDARSWVVWKRISKIAKLAREGRESGAWSSATQLAWERLHHAMSDGSGNLRDSHYLRHLCFLMQDFLRQYLFACDDLEALVKFVSKSSRQRNHHGQPVGSSSCRGLGVA